MCPSLASQYTGDLEPSPLVAPEEVVSIDVSVSDLDSEADCNLAELTAVTDVDSQGSIRGHYGLFARYASWSVNPCLRWLCIYYL